MQAVSEEMWSANYGVSEIVAMCVMLSAVLCNASRRHCVTLLRVRPVVMLCTYAQAVPITLGINYLLITG